MQSFITLGKTIYDTSKSREARRMVVFVARCLLNRGRLAAEQLRQGGQQYRTEDHPGNVSHSPQHHHRQHLPELAPDPRYSYPLGTPHRTTP